MCVILCVPEGAKDIEVGEFKKAATCHSDGYGLAYLHKGKVKYWKTMKPGSREAEFRPPKPYIMHFRLATVGGEEVKLCHPFTVDNNSRPKKTGLAKKVMFHNGHIRNWEELALAAYSSIGRLPKGPYSDSRAVAMMLGRFGENIFDIEGIINGQKFATITSDGEIKLYGTGWHEDKTLGIYRSNEQHMQNYYGYGWDGEYENSNIQGKYPTAMTKAEYPDEKECFDCGAPMSRYAAAALCNNCFSSRFQKGCYTCGERLRSSISDGFKYGMCDSCWGEKGEVVYVNCTECSAKLGNLQSRMMGLCFKCRTPRPCSECGVDLSVGERTNRDGLCELCLDADNVARIRFGVQS